jgi:hypothetical protein
MQIDIGDMVKGIQQRLSLIARPDKAANELLDILRDTHRILVKIETLVDRVDDESKRFLDKLEEMEISPERIARLEKAVFNIERATLGVEASMSALPRVFRTRIDRRRMPAAGEGLQGGLGDDAGYEP